MAVSYSIFQPIELIKFDIKFGLKVLGQYEQKIHMTGKVIEPNLNTPESEFNYGDVPILMKASKQFHIENKVGTRKTYFKNVLCSLKISSFTN
ncbi:unnamed protein product [Rotaria sp. Silwood2]|nr:unnamed protein product [Rotaria sp. Silwood2]